MFNDFCVVYSFISCGTPSADWYLLLLVVSVIIHVAGVNYIDINHRITCNAGHRAPCQYQHESLLCFAMALQQLFYGLWSDNWFGSCFSFQKVKKSKVDKSKISSLFGFVIVHVAGVNYIDINHRVTCNAGHHVNSNTKACFALRWRYSNSIMCCDDRTIDLAHVLASKKLKSQKWTNRK